MPRTTRSTRRRMAWSWLRRHATVVTTWLTLGAGATISLTVATLLSLDTVWPPVIRSLIRARPIPDTEWAAAWSADAISQAGTQAAGISVLTTILAALAIAATSMALINVLALAAERAIAQRRNDALRSAVGATPSRLRVERARESARFFAGGLALAVLGTALAVRWLRVSWPAGLQPMEPHSNVAAFVAFLVIALPLVILILRSARVPPDLRGLLAGGSATGDRRSRKLHAIPVAAEIALALALACTTALLLRHGQANLDAVGFDADGIVALEMRTADPSAESRARMLALVLDRVHDMDGVRAESLASPGAWLGIGMRDRVMAECGMCVRAGMLMPIVAALVTHHSVSPGFFEAAAIPLVAGRAFQPEDSWDSVRVAIVNETFATRSFERGLPIGHRVQIGGLRGDWYTVIGVVRDRRARGVGAPRADMPAIYLSTQQQPPFTIGLAVRTDLEPADVAIKVEDATRDLNGTVVQEATTMHDQFDRAVQPLHWFGRIFTLIAFAAFAFAFHGVFASVREFTRTRRREIAIRAAIGAGPVRLAVLALRHTARITAAGLLIGAIVAWTAGRALQMSIGGIPTLDPVSAAAFALAIAVTAIAGAIPHAVRAAFASPASVMLDP